MSRLWVILALCLTFAATSAAAECAWVLWEGQPPKKGMLPLAAVDKLSLTRLAAFPTFEACGVAAKTEAESTATFLTMASQGTNKSKATAVGSAGVWEVDLVLTAPSGRDLR